MALPKKNRITSESDYRLIFKDGKTVKNSFFFIKYTSNGLNYCRWGVVVPVKVSKSSVKRNRIRRIISETIRKNYLSNQVDAVITAYPTILEKSSDEIKSQLEKDIKKIIVNA